MLPEVDNQLLLIRYPMQNYDNINQDFKFNKLFYLELLHRNMDNNYELLLILTELGYLKIFLLYIN